MKKTTSILYLLLFVSGFLYSQDINGIVYFQNSGGKTATGVQISAFGCNSTYSKGNGMFTLPCPQKESGQKLKLVIGNVDDTGKSIEVVNLRQLEWLRVPDKSDTDPIEIIICFAGQKDESALHYYGILSRSVSIKFEEKINNLEKLVSKSNVSKEELKTLLKEIEHSSLEKNKALEKIEEQAEYIASINTDQASKIVLEAIQKINLEENIDAALSILDNAKLNEAFQKALSSKRKAEKEISNVLEGYKLKINLLKSQFKYKEAIETYEEAYNLIIENKIYTYEAFYLIEGYILLLQDYGLHKVAKEKYITLRYFFKYAEPLRDEDRSEVELTLGELDLRFKFNEGKIDVFEYLSETVLFQKNFEGSDSLWQHNRKDSLNTLLQYFVLLDSISTNCFLEEEGETMSPQCWNMVDTLINITSTIYSDRSKCRASYLELLKAQLYGYNNDSIFIRILKDAEKNIVNEDSDCFGLSKDIYLPLSEHYFSVDDSINGSNYLDKALKIVANAPDSLLEDVVDVFGRISRISALDLDKRNSRLTRFITKIESQLNPNDIMLVPLYHDAAFLQEEISFSKYEEEDYLGGNYNEVNKVLLSAIEWYEKALRIERMVYHPNHEDIAYTLRTIGDVYSGIENDSNYFKALEYYLQTTMIYKSIDGELSLRTKNVNDKIADIYFMSHDYENALINIRNCTFGSLDTTLLCNGMAIKNQFQLIKKFVLQSDEELQLFNWSKKDTLDAIRIIQGTLNDYEEHKLCMQSTYSDQLKLNKETFTSIFYLDIISFLGGLYLSIGEHDKAKNVFHKLGDIDNSPLFSDPFSTAEAVSNWVKYYLAIGDQKEVDKILDEESRKGNTRLFKILNRFDDFSYIDLFIYILEAEENDKLKGLASTAFYNKDYTTAITHYDSLNNLYNDYRNINMMGLSYYYLNDFSKAIELFQQSYAMDSINAKKNYFNNIGISYVKNRQFKKAKAAFIENELLFPDRGKSFRNWAMYYALQGEKIKALENLQKATELGYRDLNWIEKDTSIDILRSEKEFKEIVLKIKKEKEEEKEELKRRQKLMSERRAMN